MNRLFSPLLASALLLTPTILIRSTLAQTTTAPSATTQSASQPTSLPTSLPALSAELETQVKKLIQELADADYQKRESSQKKLAELGEPILPLLVQYVNDKNPEISQRVDALIGRPRNAVVRVEVAFHLLISADPDLMERAVTMLFESPVEDYDLFVQRTAETKGIQREVCKVVASQMHLWKQATEIAQRQYERFRETKPDAAERTLKLHRESRPYQIEAAYWTAIDVMEEYVGEGESAPSNPENRPTSAPSR